MMTKPVLLIPLFLLAFVAMWLGVNLLLGVVSGWRRLSRSYRGQLLQVEWSATGSGLMRGVGYNGIVTFSTGPYGIGMSLLPLFSVGSPPLAIPWQAISDCRRYRLLGMFDRFSFRVDDVRMTASGTAARLLDDAWRTWGTEAVARQPGRGRRVTAAPAAHSHTGSG